MADFGKLNFSISFNPTSAFPLDARTYFEGDDALERATAAARQAEAIGSTNTIYYYGQKLLVNQGGVYAWYEIMPDNTLRPELRGIALSQEAYDALPQSEKDNNTIVYLITKE